MEYELGHIEKKVREAIRSNPSVLDQFSSSLHEDVKSVLKSIQLNALSFDSTKELKRYIQYHQQAVIMQLDEVVEHMESSPHCKKLGEVICAELEKVLEFLKGSYPKQFSSDSQTPKTYSTRIKKNLLPQIETIRTAINEYPIGPSVKEMCLNILSDFACQLDEQPSFRTVSQTENLIAEFERIDLDDNDSRWLEEQIGSMFLELNFNNPSTRCHFIQYFKSDLHSAESLVEQIERMAGFLKYVNQAHIKPEFISSEIDIPLKETLAAWVYEELQFMNSKYQMTMLPGSNKDGLRSNFKIDFDMSVSQFACFTKTLVDAGIIQNKNVSELIRFLASYVKTKRSENISHESFRMKYYNIESNTKNAVRNLLHSAIGHINID